MRNYTLVTITLAHVNVIAPIRFREWWILEEKIVKISSQHIFQVVLDTTTFYPLHVN